MRSRRAAARVGSLIVAAGLGGAPASARAVSPEAETLFQEGRRFLAEGHLFEACGRFADSYRADASSGTLLNLALCHEKLGRSATALAEYREAERLARTQEREDRAVTARAKADELEAKVPRLTIVVARAVEGIEVTADGGVVSGAELGAPLPVDPGPHEILATAPGHRQRVIVLDIKAGEHLRVDVPALEPEAPPPPAAVPPAKAPAASLSAAIREPRPRVSRAELAAGVGGGLLLVGGVVVWSVAVSKFTAAQDVCGTPPGCLPGDYNARVDTIERLELVALGAWVAGGALFAGAAVHHFWGRKTGPDVALVAPTSGGVAVSLGGAF